MKKNYSGKLHNLTYSLVSRLQGILRGRGDKSRGSTLKLFTLDQRIRETRHHDLSFKSVAKGIISKGYLDPTDGI